MPFVPRYQTQIWSSSATTFGPVSMLAEIENAKNLGYSEYLNEVGEAFFTMSQADPKTEDIKAFIEDDLHLRIYRSNLTGGTDLMWGGWLSEIDETQDDVILYAHDYKSTLFWMHTDWEQTFAATSTIGTDIIKVLWDAAQAKLRSMTNWMTDGTFENPVTTSGGGTAIQTPYRASYRRLLFVFQELVAMAQSDTTNRVWFEITPAGVFNLWKDRGSDLTDIALFWGGQISGFRRYRLPVDRRNVILAVGSSPKALTLRDEEGTPPAGEGRREESIYLSSVRDATELDRVAKLRRAQAQRVDSSLTVQMPPGLITPARATGAEFALADSFPIIIDRGLTNMNSLHMVTGQQVVVSRGKEHLRLLMRDTL